MTAAPCIPRSAERTLTLGKGFLEDFSDRLTRIGALNWLRTVAVNTAPRVCMAEDESNEQPANPFTLPYRGDFDGFGASHRRSPVRPRLVGKFRSTGEHRARAAGCRIHHRLVPPGQCPGRAAVL